MKIIPAVGYLLVGENSSAFGESARRPALPNAIRQHCEGTMKYRWDGMYCVDTTDGEIVGRSFKYDSNPDRWVAERGGSKSLYISAEQARAAVEQGICGRDGTIEHSPRTNMLKEITTDAKAFIHDNRNIIYWLALAFLADHFFFGGAFRQRLNALVEKMIGRVEKQLEAKA